MLKHKIFVLKAICFSLILFTVITQVNYILTPKKYFDDEWPTTATFHGFYQMPKNSVDVLLLGSSHMASGLIPQSIYNSYGITSYNLGCEQQNLLISYYWLQEALRFQTPKVVILDTYMLFEYNRLEPLNTSESSTRMAIDPMRWSPVKWNAVKDICTYDSNQTFNSYLFKNIRFHARWSSLTEQDFSFKKYESHYELKGYAPLNSKETKHSTDYEPYENYNTLWTTDMVPIMEKYLDKITELCKENNIPLILIKTPTSQWNIAKHNTTNEYAQKNNLTFLDFNEASLYADSHFDFTEDMSDVGHCNIWGAQKLSTYISQYLYQHYHIAQNTFHKYWSETDSYFQEIMQNCELKYITDIFQYIDAIQQDRYTIFISSQYDSSNFMDEDTINKFKELGLEFDIEPYDSYYAVINSTETVEQHDQNSLSYWGTLRNNSVQYQIVSNNMNTGIDCSILINHEETAQQQKGINIVIYDNVNWKVIDSAYYDGRLHGR